MLNDDFADLQPGQAQTDDQKINVLLDLLASGFEGVPDLDLVRDSALAWLIQFPRLPKRTLGVMQAILATRTTASLFSNEKKPHSLCCLTWQAINETDDD